VIALQEIVSLNAKNVIIGNTKRPQEWSDLLVAAVKSVNDKALFETNKDF